MRLITLLIAVIALAACGSQDEPSKESSTEPNSQASQPAASPAVQQEVADTSPQGPLDLEHDYFSFANTVQFVTLHLNLDLTVDFDKQELRGTAVLSMSRLDQAASDIILDTRDLHIEAVSVNGEEASFAYSQTDEVLGQALKITLPDGQQASTELQVVIHYQTDPTASALQWLPPELTAGGQHPYMFSQSQSIHARSWVPLQDSPAVRLT